MVKMNCPCCNQPLPSGTPVWNVVVTDIETGGRFMRETFLQEFVALGNASARNRMEDSMAVESDRPRRYQFTVERDVAE